MALPTAGPCTKVVDVPVLYLLLLISVAKLLNRLLIFLGLDSISVGSFIIPISAGVITEFS